MESTYRLKLVSPVGLKYQMADTMGRMLLLGGEGRLQIEGGQEKRKAAAAEHLKPGANPDQIPNAQTMAFLDQAERLFLRYSWLHEPLDALLSEACALLTQPEENPNWLDILSVTCSALAVRMSHLQGLVGISRG
ncbi:hypothetical protein AK812_SmicGene10792 [Symbiodinium microadriaticum]|uniref:Uncharacterized protein n=1 Tax=Symbiodinium microadriaticum TaxID=2951 RepID=A0A1Q9EEY4_SYMMI|nr:hypothetical protein AK812_SmicGene10792 [Symbiodinium microadriaticum]